jgi:phosphate transport system substrate-binding protein
MCACSFLAAEQSRVMIVADNISNYLKETIQPYSQKDNSRILIRSGDSDIAIDLVLKKEADIAAITRSLYQDEKDQHPELEEVPIASDALVFIVHPSNPLKVLTKEQIQSIYTVPNMTWGGLIGNQHPLSKKNINPISKADKNGSFKAFMRYFQFSSSEESGNSIFFHQHPYQKNTAKVSSVSTDKAAIAQLSVRPESIAFVSLTALLSYQEGKDFKIVAYNKIVPSVTTVFNRSYPLTYRLNFITSNRNENFSANKYIEWILDGEGQDIFREFGLAPINLKTKIIHTTSSYTRFRRY